MKFTSAAMAHFNYLAYSQQQGMFSMPWCMRGTVARWQRKRTRPAHLNPSIPCENRCDVPCNRHGRRRHFLGFPHWPPPGCRATGEVRQLHRAQQMAALMRSPAYLADVAAAAPAPGRAQPQHPFSLLDGLAGAACLYADLLRPDRWEAVQGPALMWRAGVGYL